jgi:hypothetical protein
MYTCVVANALHYFEQRHAIPTVPMMLKNSKHMLYCCQSLSCIPALFKKAMPLRWPHRFAEVRVWNILYFGIKKCRGSNIRKPSDLSVHHPVMEVFVPVSCISSRNAMIICGL